MDHECVKNSIGETYSRKKFLLLHRYYAFMSVVDRVLLEISRVIEAIFDEIEYRNAKAERDRKSKAHLWRFMTFGSERLLKNLLSKYQHLPNYRHLLVVHVGNFQRKRKQ